MLIIDSLVSALRGTWQALIDFSTPWNWPILQTLFPADRRRQTPEVRNVERHVEELLDEFQATEGTPSLPDSAREAFRLLGEIPALLHWDEGLDEAQRDIVLCAIYQAERFGDGTGSFKRRFALDLIVRVLRRYNQNGFPFIPPIEDAFVKPLLGIFVDWSVIVLNIHDAWPPVRTVRVPALFQGRYGRLMRVGLWLLRAWISLRSMFFFPSKYERSLREATAAIEPQIRRLLIALPPEQTHSIADELLSILAQVGQITAPHLHTIDSLLRLSVEMEDLGVEERRQAIFEVVRTLLARAYTGTPFAVDFIESAFGEFMIREMIRTVEWVLERNGLLDTRAASKKR